MALGVSAAEAGAGVDLELRSARPIGRVGATIEVGLFAVATEGMQHAVIGLEAIVQWDPAVLELVGVRGDGTANWANSWFPNDQGLDGLNADCGPALFCDPYTELPYNDGMAKYQAFAFAPGVTVTSAGLRVTTLLFTALAPAEATVGLVPAAGSATVTRVLDGDPEYLGRVITGGLRAASMSIAGCGTHGDSSNDCLLTLGDVAGWTGCLSGPGTPVAAPGCPASDHDGDGDGDLQDLQAFFLSFDFP